jgi:hypothetical protein
LKNDIWFMYLMPATVRDFSYANCLRNDMLNCLCFIKKAYVKAWFMKWNAYYLSMSIEHETWTHKRIIGGPTPHMNIRMN